MNGEKRIDDLEVTNYQLLTSSEGYEKKKKKNQNKHVLGKYITYDQARSNRFSQS